MGERRGALRSEVIAQPVDFSPHKGTFVEVKANVISVEFFQN